ncbi:hypothetical protein HOLleu_28764 [Holothuria leucospilota]|uniref:TIR domain-containing protein n=1 Tax=Holothuria leucospilota TaxID=206669 RepID=A0A9Q1H263_HOLLE|nr:hypothetical protein HOLleu_28764 [Holothuria leucospilota]
MTGGYTITVTMENEKEIYDFVVFFADEDQKIANEIYSFLESDEHGLHGYCKYRDGELGGYVIEQIMDVVQESKKIILLMSKNSVNEGNFNFCSVASVTEAIKRNVRKVIPVVLDLSPTDPEIPDYIQILRCIQYSHGYEKQLLKCFGKNISVSAAETCAMKPLTIDQPKKEENILSKKLSHKFFSSLLKKS